MGGGDTGAVGNTAGVELGDPFGDDGVGTIGVRLGVPVADPPPANHRQINDLTNVPTSPKLLTQRHRQTQRHKHIISPYAFSKPQDIKMFAHPCVGLSVRRHAR